MINPPTHQNWIFIRVVNRVQSTNPNDWLIVWLIIQQWFDNDCLINQLAWLIIWQWLSHIDHSGLINQLIKFIIHSSSQLSWINQPAWLIIRVIDCSTMIQQWLIYIDGSWVQSTNLHDWLFGWLVIQQWFDDECLINQLAWLIICQWFSPVDYSWFIY